MNSKHARAPPGSCRTTPKTFTLSHITVNSLVFPMRTGRIIARADCDVVD